ncbi:MAG TPA: ATP-dependent DNA ligase [Pyrinomonadaceae bacterium]|nr:ATP-dependent DNA ligase [Pyrinomonadaceae bacterium]
MHILYDRVSQAASNSKRVKLLADTFKHADTDTLRAIAHFTMSELVQPELSGQLGIGPGMIRDQIAALAHKDTSEIEEEIRETGDISQVVAAYGDGKDDITVDELWKHANKTVERNNSRSAFVSHVFKNTTASGAKYFTRMALNQMRINVGLGTLTSAMAGAFDVSPDAIEHLYAMTNDIGLAAVKSRVGEAALEHTGLMLFHPYQFMNAHKVDDPDLIIPSSKPSKKKWMMETKYDGARLQIHIQKKPWKVRLYSRRLNDDTDAMPDIVDAVQDAWTGGDAIVEGEAVAFDPDLKKRLPFQAVLQRLGRKHRIKETIEEIPLVLFLFDILFDRDQNLMNVSQSERRARLEKLFVPTTKVKWTESIVSNERSDMDSFFEKAVKAGQEGIMVKDPDGIYIPGRRTSNWLKLKPAFETLDVIIVGGIWGSGRRKGLLSSLIVAVRGTNDDLLTVGKVGTGFSEATLKDLTERLRPLILTTRGHNVEIEPQIVIEADFQDIQKTDRYKAGYVLRIPRFKRERPDKSIKDADTLVRLKKLYNQAH